MTPHSPTGSRGSRRQSGLIHLAVALVSAASLAYEILLVKMFSVEHFHHFAYMAIGVAMLGFGASGTVLALLPRPGPSQTGRWFVGSAVAAAVALLLSPALVHQIAFDPTQLAWDLSQWPRLGLIYLLLALPFAAGALAILLALTVETARTGRVYGASFIGSGFGAGLALGVQWVLVPRHALALPALLAAGGAMVAAAAPLSARSGKQSSASRRVAPLAAGVVAMVLAVGALIAPPWQLTITPFKGLPQVEAYPDARRVAESTSPLGWVVAVQAPAFRFAPGLSLGFTGELPPQVAVFVDGNLAAAATTWGSDSAARAVLDWLPSAAAFAADSPHHALVLGAGDGTGVANALVHGARAVTAVEIHPHLLELAVPSVASLTRHAHQVEWVAGDARNFVSRTSDRFDLVTIGATVGAGFTSGGVHSLNEDFLHTVNAYVEYLHRLSAPGILSITGWLTIPPRTNLRVMFTAAEALSRLGYDVASAMMVLRSWATVTVLVKPMGFREDEVAAVQRWAAHRGFDLDWAPGLLQPSDPFNRLDQPVFFRAGQAIRAGDAERRALAAAYPFDVAPVTDARPYPHHFLRPRAIPAFLRNSRGTWLPFAEWGFIALVAALVQSVLLAALCMLAPVALRGRRPPAARLVPLVVYFVAIGIAFMAAEIAAIQQLGLLLGHPVYAVTAVLAGFLIFSGLGSTWSDRLRVTQSRAVNGAIAIALVVCAIGLLAVVHHVQGAHLVARVAIALVVLAPLAFLMGSPFPLGIRAFGQNESLSIAWAWAANGFASVVATPLAALVALEAGTPIVFLMGAAGYTVAAGVGGKVR